MLPERSRRRMAITKGSWSGCWGKWCGVQQVMKRYGVVPGVRAMFHVQTGFVDGAPTRASIESWWWELRITEVCSNSRSWIGLGWLGGGGDDVGLWCPASKFLCIPD